MSDQPAGTWFKKKTGNTWELWQQTEDGPVYKAHFSKETTINHIVDQLNKGNNDKGSQSSSG